MPKWGETDPAYIAYLEKVADDIYSVAKTAPPIPTTDVLERWHRLIYKPITGSEGVHGRIRRVDARQPQLNVVVTIERNGIPLHNGLPSAAVPLAMQAFSNAIRGMVATLDTRDAQLEPVAKIKEVAGLIAFVHGEIVRIHPFCNGNGRVARLAVNVLLLRYGFPIRLSLRPRPGGDYEYAADESMKRNHTAMASFLLREIVFSAPRVETGPGQSAD
jgi:fido (protein-threonine AMPylation protein)